MAHATDRLRIVRLMPYSGECPVCGAPLHEGQKVSTVGMIARTAICLSHCEPVKPPGDYRQARAVGGWQEGDELPEDRIRRGRDTERGGEGN